MRDYETLTPEDIQLNNIVSTKMLFKSDFQPQPQDEELNRTMLQLKLNSEYRDALQKFKKAKEKE